MQKNKIKGFTLVELLVVIAIIGILAALIMVGLRYMRTRAYDVQRKADATQINYALRGYANDNNEQFPASNSSVIAGYCPSSTSGRSEDLRSGSCAGRPLVNGNHLSKVPVDPVTKNPYTYISPGDDTYTVETPLAGNPGSSFICTQDGCKEERNPGDGSSDDSTSSDGGSSDGGSLPEDDPLLPIAKIPGQSPNAKLGYSIAAYSNRVIVGNGIDDSGDANYTIRYANLYDANGSLVKVLHEGSSEPTAYGMSVAVSSNRIVVGAYKSNSAYIYDIDGNRVNIGQTGSNRIHVGSSEEFGYSVAISDNRIIVGARKASHNGLLSGSVYTYDLNGNFKAMLNGERISDSLGQSVAASGNKVVIGSNSYDPGKFYICDENVQSLTSCIKKEVTTDDTHVGNYVSMSQNKILVAGETFNAGKVSSFADLYDTNGNYLNVRVQDNLVDSNFGWPSAIGSDRIVAYSFDPSSGHNQGSVYIYDMSGQQLEKLSGEAELDVFGSAIAISNGKIYIGSMHNDVNGTDSGALYIYPAQF